MKKEQNHTNAAGFPQESAKEKRFWCAMIVIVALLFAVGCFFLGMLAGRREENEEESSLFWMVDTVERNYREEVSRDELFDKLYDSLALDKFCTHYTPEEYAEKVRESEGRNDGYGISFTASGGVVRIYRVVGNSPAELSGIARGMYVYAVNGEKPSSSAEAKELLLASEGGTVLSCGYTADASDAKTYSLTPGDYLASYCSYADSDATFRFRGDDALVLTETGEGIASLPSDTAYISLLQFEGNAAWEFETCLNKMKERGKEHLVLDLRSNGGGYLSILCDISAHLLRNAEGRDPVILQAFYRDGSTETYRASGNDFSSYFSAHSRISVLADENSASASEALMGALIDYGTCAYSDFYLHEAGGTVRTYGKGVMQTHFTAPDGNVLLLTVANIHWPQGRSIHGTGITAADGAVGIAEPSLPGEKDTFLSAVCELL